MGTSDGVDDGGDGCLGVSNDTLDPSKSLRLNPRTLKLVQERVLIGITRCFFFYKRSIPRV